VEEAERHGITIDELKARRRAQAEADRELGEEARRLGITAKELRRRRSEG
jgi:hypothetical protein